MGVLLLGGTLNNPLCISTTVPASALVGFCVGADAGLSVLVDSAFLLDDGGLAMVAIDIEIMWVALVLVLTLANGKGLHREVIPVLGAGCPRHGNGECSETECDDCFHGASNWIEIGVRGHPVL